MRLAAGLMALALFANPALARDQGSNAAPSEASVAMVTSCINAAAAAYNNIIK